MDHSHTDHAHHVIPDKVLNRTFGILLVLMVLTIAAARIPYEGVKMFKGFEPYIHQFQSLWLVTNAIAIGIAVVKTVFVIQNFMGVKYSTKLVRLYAICGFVGFTLLFIMFFDYAGRSLEPVRGWEKMPSSAFPRERETEAGQPYQQFPGSEEEKVKHEEGGH